MSFGAEVSLNVSKQTTHVIANPDRKTMKVKKAAHYPSIKIVNADWMFQCCTRWEHVDETPYLIEIDQTDRGASPWDELEESDPGVTGDEDGEAAEEDISKIDMSPDKWKDLDDEFNEFMNESDDSETNSASDSESVRSDASAQITDSKPSIKKRKRTTGSVDGSEADESDVSVTSTSKLQRRKKRTMERVTSLANVVTAEKSSGLPSPETTGPEEGHGDEEKDADPAGLAADDSDPEEDDGLEAEMMAEFGKSDDEDAA
jgi:RNA polymerase II subunit A-like phosphatase